MSRERSLTKVPTKLQLVLKSQPILQRLVFVPHFSVKSELVWSMTPCRLMRSSFRKLLYTRIQARDCRCLRSRVIGAVSVLVSYETAV